MEEKRRLKRAELVGAVFVALICLGLLVPLLGKFGETRRRSICLNNLKKIGLAMRLYSGDCLEAFPTDAAASTLGTFRMLAKGYWAGPSGWFYGPFQPGYREWNGPGIADYQAWVCPSDAGIAAGSLERPFTSENLSYAYGGFGMKETTQPDTPLACDRSSQGDPMSATPWANNRWTHRSDGGNVLFADGHVEFRKIMVPPMYNAKNP